MVLISFMLLVSYNDVLRFIFKKDSSRLTPRQVELLVSNNLGERSDDDRNYIFWRQRAEAELRADLAKINDTALDKEKIISLWQNSLRLTKIEGK